MQFVDDLHSAVSILFEVCAILKPRLLCLHSYTYSVHMTFQFWHGAVLHCHYHCSVCPLVFFFFFCLFCWCGISLFFVHAGWQLSAMFTTPEGEASPSQSRWGGLVHPLPPSLPLCFSLLTSYLYILDGLGPGNNNKLIGLSKVYASV